MTHNLLLIALSVTVLVGGAAAVAFAEEPADHDPLQALLYSPELVMKHQTSVRLSPEQRKELITEITQAQADFLPKQMEMAEFAEILERRLAESRVDEDAALGAATRIMELEGQIKRRHLRLAIRIKNLLTEEQKKMLDDLRQDHR